MDDRELDGLIAEKFFGLQVDGDEVIYDDGSRGSLPYYSINPIGSSLILNEIERRGWYWTWRGTKKLYAFEILLSPTVPDRTVFALESSRYRAVCNAVLKAVEQE